MRFHQNDFLASDLGFDLKDVVNALNEAEYNNDQKVIAKNKAKWSVYEIIFRELYNKDCYLHKIHDYYGVVLCNKKGDDWLIKVDRAGIIKDRHYTNSDRECECYLCEYEKICPWVEKQQRFDDSHYGGLSECWKLQKNDKKK